MPRSYRDTKLTAIGPRGFSDARKALQTGKLTVVTYSEHSGTAECRTLPLARRTGCNIAAP